MLSCNNKIVIFDLDGTLAESKSQITPAMAESLQNLLKDFEVAVVSGGAWFQFETQLVNHLSLEDELAKKLHLFPTSGTSYYQYFDDVGWKQIYSETLSDEESCKILQAFDHVLSTTSVDLPQKIWGKQIENRGSQITFSAMGQDAPSEAKKNWDPSFKKRLVLIEELLKIIPEFAIRTGGSTSIDVTKPGFDKSFAIKQIEKFVRFKKDEMLFVGDALFPGGNDYAVFTCGVRCIETSGPDYTINIIQELIERQ